MFVGTLFEIHVFDTLKTEPKLAIVLEIVESVTKQ